MSEQFLMKVFVVVIVLSAGIALLIYDRRARHDLANQQNNIGSEND